MARSMPLAALALAAATTLVPCTATAQSGSYTAAQAESGRRIFGAYCATCHGVDLEGAVGPALAGSGFLHKWSTKGAAELFHVLRTTMPKPAMGSLSPDAYAEVFAYILSRNGASAGNVAFDGSAVMLHDIPLDSLAVAAGPAPEAAPAFIAGTRTRPEGAGPTQAELTTPDSSDWLYATGNYHGTRYSRLAQITTANVGRLAPVCAYQLGVLETFYSNPIIYRGTMYVTTPTVTAAIDAATCRERWRTVWQPKDQMLWKANRGVAIADGYVVRGTADGYLMALDAADGTLLWARHVAQPDSGETITMPPLIVDSLVIIGPAGSENNIQGWIGAFRLTDGTPVWRFNTIPRPGEPGSETWSHPGGYPSGGGAVWTPLSLDVERGQLFVGVTNPAPDIPAHLRPGANLYTNSVVVLNVHTGKLLWYDQMVPEDDHDYDLTQVSPLIRTKVNGVERDLLITAGKDGLLHALDRRTHERLYQTAVTTRKNVDVPITLQGTVACPGPLGGVEWNGPAWDPGTQSLYVPAVDWCFKFIRAPDDSVRFVPGELYLGGTVDSVGPQRGWLTAVHARTGAVRWRYHSSKAMVAAVTTTAGGLVFTGEATGDFLAFDAATGKKLFDFDTGAGIYGGVATYAVHGRQYVATTSGGGSLNFGGGGGATVFVFGLPKSR
ncbi:MAG TPA: PQQ-binding-like beta-propeller repeat protein [Gemmatimonadales bacterium]|nr:PQQ-binding-like beta-propeller repeat protein [Gemmatimonadales bacterium]